jgi:single-strand DNA-binding protein
MSNLNLNKVILGGRLTNEPELKTTQSGLSVVSFSVAVNRKTKQGEEQKADFFNVTAWRQTAEFVSRYFKKGSSICIVGALQNSSWTDQNNQKHYRTDIVADEVMFVDSKSDGGQTTAPGAFGGVVPKFEEISTDADLPF